MQTVDNCGNLGPVELFDEEKINKHLDDPNIDHVNVFKLPNGGKVTETRSIDDALIEDAAAKAVEKIEEKRKLQQEFKFLKQEFDNKIKNKLKRR